MSEPTCGTCMHWRRAEPPALDASGAAQISADGIGECREQLHLIVVPSPRGPAVMAVHARVAGNFPCCSRYKGDDR